jgi:hypothetical protein
MKSLFDPACVRDIKARLARLKLDSPRQWGKMNAPQAVAHCAAGVEMALGDRRPPRLIIGGIVGHFIKPMVFRDDEPMRRNSPTVKDLVVQDERDLAFERDRLCGLMDRFAESGRASCTSHPHAFFGPLTPDEWAILMYKHLDHHLRQFGF